MSQPAVPRLVARLAIAVGLAVALMMAFATNAFAATINVSTTQQLVTAVASGTPGDEIVLAQGSYAPQTTLQVSRNLTIRGPAGSLTNNARISGGNITLSDPPDLFVIDPGVTLTVQNITLTTVANNGKVADIFGGLALENVTVSGNNGVSLLVESGATLNTLNTTISDNAEFGAIVSADSTATFRSSTIAGNTLGGIGNDPNGTTTLINSIVANPSGADCQGPVQTSTNSLSRDSSCGANLTGDPLLRLLTNNGGPTSTRGLNAGSPALDAGAANCPPIDQRFATRSAAPCDIGAYERDRTAPALTVPANITRVTTAASAVVNYTTTATEPDGFLRLTNPVVCSTPSGASFPAGTTTVTCTATNVDGLQTVRTFTVTVIQDTQAPVIVTPGDLTPEATGPGGATVNYTASATDNVELATFACTPATGGVFPLGPTTVTCTATDTAGNSSTASFTITVRDTTAPVVTVPANITTEATGPSGAQVSFTSSATDAVSGTPATTCTPASGATFALGTTTVTCSATDAAGNTGSATFTVTVVDTTAPALTVPDDITVVATSAAGAEVTYGATATDLVDGAVVPGCNPPSGSTFALGATTVTCTATDAAGNTATRTFTVTVTAQADTTPPVITVPADITAEATSAAGAVVTYDASATDNVGVASFACVPASGSTFPLGPTTVTCTASDASGNTSTASFTVTVRDTTAPVVTVPDNLTREATGSTGAAVTFTSSATDAVSGTPATTCTPASGTTFALGTTTVTCSATDAAGNTGSATFTMTVVDTTAPALTVPDDITVVATSAAGAEVTYSATATDLVDGAVVPGCNPPSGSTFPLGPTTVTCTATDAAGNATTRTFTVTVVPPGDTTPPTITVPADITAEATSAAGAAVTYLVDFADNVGVTSSSCSPASGATFALGTTTVSCTASDAAGNTATASFTVTVRDTTGPTVTGPGNLIREATSAAGATVSFTATATDLVDGALVPGCNPPSGVFPLGTTTVTCTATDAAGNSGSATFTVTVVDTTGPVVTVPGPISTPATSPSGAEVTFSASATDAVDGTMPVTCTPASGSTFPIGNTSVTCSATDAAGNPGSATFSVTVTQGGTDVTPPRITKAGNLTREATGPTGAVVTFAPVGTDNVDGNVPVTCVPPSGSTFPLGQTVVVCSATDAAGNTATKSFTVTVRDRRAPTIASAPRVRVNATSPAGAVVNYAVPTATDLVDGTVTVTCVPPPGSTFPIGTTTVTCAATDQAGNTAHRTFRVTVIGAPDQIRSLRSAVSAGIPNTTANRPLKRQLRDQLDDALDAACNSENACPFLDAFIATVQANTDPAGPITAEQSATWVADANRIRAVLGCEEPI